MRPAVPTASSLSVIAQWEGTPAATASSSQPWVSSRLLGPQSVKRHTAGSDA
nr:hypothetical protein [Demequina sediminis]